MSDLQTQLSKIMGVETNKATSGSWSVGEDVKWIILKKENLKLVVSAAVLELWTINGITNVPNNLENYGPLMNQSSKPRRVTRKDWEEYGLPYYRFANWLRALGRMESTRRFLSKTQSHRGFNSDRTFCDLWRVWERYPSPGRFAKWLNRTIARTKKLAEPLEFRPSWWSIAMAAERGPRRPNKAAVYAAALNLQDDIRSYRQARECLAQQAWRTPKSRYVSHVNSRCRCIAEETLHADYVGRVLSFGLSREIRRQMPRGLTENLKPGLRKSLLKTWRRYSANIPQENRTHSFFALMKLYLFFGRRPDEVLGLVDRGVISLHDAGIGLPNESLSMEILEWAIRHKEGWGDVPTIVGAWNRLFKGGWDPWAKGSKAEALRLLHELGIVTVKNRRLAYWASVAGYDEKQAERVEKGWEKGLRERTSSEVPNVRVVFQGWTIRRLSDDDPLILLAGAVVNCCQHPFGVGHECAWHALADNRGAIWAVFDEKGRLRAQAWVWRAEDVLIVDSVEMRNAEKSNQAALSTIAHLYEAASQLCVEQARLGVERVYVGTHVNREGVEPIDNPYLSSLAGIYTDAKKIVPLASKRGEDENQYDS